MPAITGKLSLTHTSNAIIAGAHPNTEISDAQTHNGYTNRVTFVNPQDDTHLLYMIKPLDYDSLGDHGLYASGETLESLTSRSLGDTAWVVNGTSPYTLDQFKVVDDGMGGKKWLQRAPVSVESIQKASFSSAPIELVSANVDDSVTYKISNDAIPTVDRYLASLAGGITSYSTLASATNVSASTAASYANSVVDQFLMTANAANVPATLVGSTLYTGSTYDELTDKYTMLVELDGGAKPCWVISRPAQAVIDAAPEVLLLSETTDPSILYGGVEDGTMVYQPVGVTLTLTIWSDVGGEVISGTPTVINTNSYTPVEFKENIDLQSINSYVLNTIAAVPADLLALNMYTGLSYDNRDDIIAFVHPTDSNKIIVADEPGTLATHTGPIYVADNPVLRNSGTVPVNSFLIETITTGNSNVTSIYESVANAWVLNSTGIDVAFVDLTTFNANINTPTIPIVTEDTTAIVPLPMAYGKYYSGRTYNGRTDRYTMLHPGDNTKVIVFDDASVMFAGKTISATSSSVIINSFSTDPANPLDDTNIILAVTGSTDVELSVEAWLGVADTSDSNLSYVSQGQMAGARIVNLSEYELNREIRESVEFTIDTSPIVPALLQPSVVYIGTTYDGSTGKITFLHPDIADTVVIADKPVDFNTHTGGLRIT